MLFTDSDAGAAGVGVVYLSGNQPDCYESYVYAFSAGLIVLTRLDLTKAIKQLIIAGASLSYF